MKTNEQAKQPMNNWVEAGFAKERDELTRDVFKKSIGTNGVHRWTTTSLPLTAMEMAILDTMYDAGKGAEFKPKDLVNDHTRMAYVIDNNWAVYHVPDRKQESCGHDERDCYNYQIYEHYKNKEAHNGWSRRVIKEWYTDEDGCPTLEEFDKLAQEQYEKEKDYKDSRGSRLLYSRHSCHNIDHYNGECAWDKGCKHHHTHRNETALIRLVDKEDGREKQFLHKSRWGRSEYVHQFDYRFWDEEDHEALIADVSDSDVVRHIRATIPKMKTEARDWLSSTWTEYTDYDHESQTWNKVQHGKRGVYRLTWWGTDRCVRELAVRDADYDKLNGTEVNGWVFKKDGDARGAWKATINLWTVVPLNTYRRSSDQFAMNFLYKDEAKTAAQQINTAPRLSHSYGVDGAPGRLVKVEEKPTKLDLENEYASLCEKYTPLEYFVACHKGEVANESNRVCHHEEEQE